MKKRIDILGVVWKVSLLTGRQDHRLEENDGFVDFPTSSIVVNSKLPKDQQYSVLLHEIFHILSRQLDVNLSESKIMRLEGGFFQVVNSNKLKFFD